MANLFPGHQKTSAPEQNIEKPKTPEVLSSPVPELSESEWETDVTEDEQEQVMIMIVITITRLTYNCAHLRSTKESLTI